MDESCSASGGTSYSTHVYPPGSNKRSFEESEKQSSCKDKRKYDRHSIPTQDMKTIDKTSTGSKPFVVGLDEKYKRKPDSDQKMQSETGGSDKLEEYAIRIYENKCKVNADEAEVQFIENAVETFVRLYMDEYYTRMNWFNDNKCSINHCFPELLKVGSFYEKTKIGFPNEFDYLLVIGNITEMPAAPCYKVHPVVIEVLNNSFKFLRNKSSFLEYLDNSCHGPAKKFSFLYHRGKEQHRIDVDITVAVRCSPVHLSNLLKGSEVFCEDFYRKVLETGSFLLIHFPLILHDKTGIHGPWKFSLTETEMTFMEHTMSEKHRKTYMILKMLFNDPYHEDLLKQLSGTFTICFSSYHIKIAVIHHHYTCEKLGSGVADCVLDILGHFREKIEQALNMQENHDNYIVNENVKTVRPDLLIDCKYSSRKFIHEREDESTRETEKIVTHGFRVKFSLSGIIHGSRDNISIVDKCFEIFIQRLNLIRADTLISECDHESILKMLLEHPVLQEYIEHPTFIKHVMNDEKEERKGQQSITTGENSYEDKTVSCPWCDYLQPIRDIVK